MEFDTIRYREQDHTYSKCAGKFPNKFKFKLKSSSQKNLFNCSHSVQCSSCVFFCSQVCSYFFLCFVFRFLLLRAFVICHSRAIESCSVIGEAEFFWRCRQTAYISVFSESPTEVDSTVKTQNRRFS